MYDITSIICMKSYVIHMTSHPLFMISHHFIYGIKSTIYDTTSTISDLTSTVSVSSHPLYQWYQNQYMYGITSSICVTSYPLYLWHHIHYVRHQNTVCWWHHTRLIYDITCMTDDITYTLSQQTTVFMMSHPLQAWRHTHSIRHCTHCVLVITTPPLISHPLLYDITPTVYVTSCALFIRAHPLLISSNLCTYDSTKPIYETTSSKQGNIYTIYVTSQPLICIITPTVLTTSHPLFVWHHTWHMYSIFCTIEDITSTIYDIKPPFLWPHTHYIWHRIHAISVITSTVLMISYKLYGISSHI